MPLLGTHRGPNSRLESAAAGEEGVRSGRSQEWGRHGCAYASHPPVLQEISENDSGIWGRAACIKGVVLSFLLPPFLSAWIPEDSEFLPSLCCPPSLEQKNYKGLEWFSFCGLLGPG